METRLAWYPLSALLLMMGFMFYNAFSFNDVSLFDSLKDVVVIMCCIGITDCIGCLAKIFKGEEE